MATPTALKRSLLASMFAAVTASACSPPEPSPARTAIYEGFRGQILETHPIGAEKFERFGCSNDWTEVSTTDGRVLRHGTYRATSNTVCVRTDGKETCRTYKIESSQRLRLSRAPNPDITFAIAPDPAAECGARTLTSREIGSAVRGRRFYIVDDALAPQHAGQLIVSCDTNRWIKYGKPSVDPMGAYEIRDDALCLKEDGKPDECISIYRNRHGQHFMSDKWRAVPIQVKFVEGHTLRCGSGD